MSTLSEINMLYEEGRRYKELARVTCDNYDEYHKAADCFRQAAKVVIEYLKEEDVPYDVRCQLDVDNSYYLHEHYDCISSVFYEKRKIDEAIRNNDTGTKYLQKTIDKLKKYISEGKISQVLLGEFEKKLAVYEYFLLNERIKKNSILARDAWDNERLIEALDFYRVNVGIAEKSLSLVTELVEQGILPHVYKRIMLGNHAGLTANISASMAKIMHSKGNVDGKYKKLTILQGSKFIEYLVESYKLGMAAYHNNPEWEQYQFGASLALQNIGYYLELNKEKWKEVLFRYGDEPAIISLMENIDYDFLNAIQSESKTFIKVENSVNYAPRINEINIKEMHNSNIQQGVVNSTQEIKNEQGGEKKDG